jgi:FAD/FMN-containing dehydrogenase
LIDEFRAIVGEGGVLTGDDVTGRYPGYFMQRVEADVLVRPETTQQVSQIMALCNAAGQPVVIQGGMSGWVRATQTRQGEVILSLERMNRIESVDPANRTAIVQAGVILESFQDLLEPYGLSFPLDLGGRGSCQLGGNAATNAGGMRVIRYGMMREQVLGMEVVLADGRVLSSMNRMIKNNTWCCGCASGLSAAIPPWSAPTVSIGSPNCCGIWTERWAGCSVPSSWSTIISIAPTRPKGVTPRRSVRTNPIMR